MNDKQVLMAIKIEDYTTGTVLYHGSLWVLREMLTAPGQTEIGLQGIKTAIDYYINQEQPK